MNLIFLDGVLGLVLIGFLLFCLLDVITTDPAEVRNLPKIAWLLLVFINPIGGIAWLIAGRPRVDTSAAGRVANGEPRPLPGTRRTSGWTDPAPQRRPVAPDDDPEFLARLDGSGADDQRMLRQWEEDLRRREEELRRRREEDDAGN